MALKMVKGSIDRMFDKNLQDLVRGIRNHKEDEVSRRAAGLSGFSPQPVASGPPWSRLLDSIAIPVLPVPELQLCTASPSPGLSLPPAP